MKILKKIGILCDLTDSSGLGHLSRMKNLSKELEKKGLRCYYFFHQNNKKFQIKYTKNLKIIYFSNKNRIKSIETIFLKKKFSILILDSYKDNFLLEKTLLHPYPNLPMSQVSILGQREQGQDVRMQNSKHFFN